MKIIGEKLAEVEDEVIRTKECIDEHHSDIKNWSKGQIKDNIVDEQYSLYEEMEFSDVGYSKQQRMALLKKGKIIPDHQKSKKITIGMHAE